LNWSLRPIARLDLWTDAVIDKLGAATGPGAGIARASTGSNDTPATTASEVPAIIEPTAEIGAERLVPKSFPADALPARGDVPPASDTQSESWTYYQAVAYLAYGDVEVAARYGGPDNASDGGRGRRARDLSFPLQSGLPGIDAVLAIKDPNERDIALYGTVVTKPRWRGGKGRADQPDKGTVEFRNLDGWESTDADRWRAAVAEHYQAMLAGSVTAYRGTAAYGLCGLIDPAPAAAWARALSGVETCRFLPAELLSLVEGAVASGVAAESLGASVGRVMRSFTMLDAVARIAYGAEYDGRYATAEGDDQAAPEAAHRRKSDVRYLCFAKSGVPGSAAPSRQGAAAPVDPDTPLARAARRAADTQRRVVERRPAPTDPHPFSHVRDRTMNTVRGSPLVPGMPNEDQPASGAVGDLFREAKDADALAWNAAEEKLVDWLVAGEAEALDRGGNPVVPGVWEANGIRNGTELGYRVRAGGLLRLVSGGVPAQPSPLLARPGELECPVTREQFVNSRDLVPLLAQWARWKYGSGKLPGRNQLLADHRSEFGRILGISEPIIRRLRGVLASEAAKQGGAPTHRSDYAG